MEARCGGGIGQPSLATDRGTVLEEPAPTKLVQIYGQFTYMKSFMSIVFERDINSSYFSSSALSTITYIPALKTCRRKNKHQQLIFWADYSIYPRLQDSSYSKNFFAFEWSMIEMNLEDHSTLEEDKHVSELQIVLGDRINRLN